VFFKARLWLKFIFPFELFLVYSIIVFDRSYFYSVFKLADLLTFHWFGLQLQDYAILFILRIVLENMIVCIKFVFQTFQLLLHKVILLFYCVFPRKWLIVHAHSDFYFIQ
jgi:hypothetical protein